MKMMKEIRIICFVVAILCVFSACTEETTVDTYDSAYVPVIYGTITDRYVRQQIQISSSCGYFSKEDNKKLSGAVVTIEEDSAEVSHTYSLMQDSVGSGIYFTESPLAGKIGWTYQLNVSLDFDGDGTKENYTAQSKMPNKLDLDSIGFVTVKGNGHTFHSLCISAQEEKGVDNYYFGKYRINDTLYNQISKYICANDRSVDGQYLKKMAVSYFHDLADKDDMDEDDAKEEVFLKQGDSVTLEMSNVEKGYFDFISDCQSQKNGSNPMFGGPPANITTNLSGGARGYFTAYAISSASCFVP